MKKEKTLAIQLRKRGKSYNEIVKILNVPKSTLAQWLRNVEMPLSVKKKLWRRTRKKWAQNITEFNKKRAEESKYRAIEMQKKASKTIGKISERELLLIGSALYWAEGYKKARWVLQFSNSDPAMIKIIMLFFKKICKIPEEKIKAMVQIHPNITSEKAINYWSKISGVAKTRFSKSYSRLTPSSKQKRPLNTLPYGTLRIVICDVLMVNKVKGWIQGISEKI